MEIFTCILVASIATPIIGSCVLMVEWYLRWYKCRKADIFDDSDILYVELPKANKVYIANELPKSRTHFLNKTLFDAASHNCPILCKLLIEQGATETNRALEIAIINGHIGICKLIVTFGSCDVEKGLHIAKTLHKHDIESYLADYIKNERNHQKLE